MLATTYHPKTQPYQHQADALRAGWDKIAFAYFMDMGTGKTKVTIDNFWMLYCAGRVEQLLVIAPNGVHTNWVRREIPTHTPDFLLEIAQMHAWAGGGTKREQQQLDSLMYAGHPRILAVNVEGLGSVRRLQELCWKFVCRAPTMVVVDESTRIKNHEAKRTEVVTTIGARAAYRRILSGQPAPKGPLDLYSQFYFLNPRFLRQSSYWGFRKRYAVLQKQGFRYVKDGQEKVRQVEIVVSYRNTDELRELIAPHRYRIRKEQCLDLPPKVYMFRDVQLTDEQKRIYQQMIAESQAEIEGGLFASATSVIQRMLRLHQVACGHVVDEDGNIHDIPTRRIDALVDVLEEVESKAIVWCTYRHDLVKVVARLRREFGDAAVVSYFGDTSREDRERAVDGFQNDPRVRFFVGTPHAGGIGITLHRAGTVVYYSNSYDLELRAQSEDRAHRIGQEHQSVTYVDLRVPDTVDDRIVHALRSKIDLAAAIMQDGPQKWLV